MPSIPRAFMASRLAQAEEAVRFGHAHIARQVEIIAELEHEGHDTAQARDLLRTFRDTLAGHEADRNRLLSELSGPLADLQ